MAAVGWQQIRKDSLYRLEYSLIYLGEKFNASDFKEFKLGYKTKEVILKEFLNLVPITPEGFITQEEFFNFYTDLSINIPSDQAFSDFVSAQWGVPLQKVSAPGIEEVKSALKNIRFKLLQRTNGTHE